MEETFRRFLSPLLERLVRPIVRRKIRTLLASSIRGAVAFSLLALAGATVFAWSLKLAGTELHYLYLAALAGVSAYRMCKGVCRLGKLYSESSWLSRKLLKIGLRSAMADRLALTLVAGYLMLSTAIWSVRKCGLEWLL